MKLTTYRPAVVIVDPNQPGKIIERVAGPFESDADAEREYRKLADANDAAYDAGAVDFITYAVRYVEVIREIADADFADDRDASDDRPAEALGAGTFSARLAAYADAERAASAPAAAPAGNGPTIFAVYATGDSPLIVGDGFAGSFASTAEAETAREVNQTIADSAGFAFVYEVREIATSNQPKHKPADAIGPLDITPFAVVRWSRRSRKTGAARLSTDTVDMRYLPDNGGEFMVRRGAKLFTVNVTEVTDVWPITKA